MIQKLLNIGYWWKLARLVAVLPFRLTEFQLARAAIGRFHAVQRLWELMSLLHLVKNLRPATILEIGTHHGGTLYCWAHLAQESALLISLDLPGGNFGGGYDEAQAQSFRSFLKPGQHLECLRMDSHLPSSREAVVHALGGRALDFLFIDGDHTYIGVKEDYETYGPLVRSGGLIAFHDIRENPVIPDSEVQILWAEVKQGQQHIEFIDKAVAFETGMGIGVILR